MPELSGPKILVIGASNKATRAVIKSLVRNHNCLIYILNDTDLALSKSKFVTKYILKPEITDNISIFKNEIFSAIETYSIDLLLPSSDNALDIVSFYKEEFTSKIKVIGLNETDVYKYAYNKFELLELAQKFDIKTPKYKYIDSTEIDPTCFDGFTFPLVLKPISSSCIANNRIHLLKVFFPKNVEEAIDFLRELTPSSPVMIQEFIEGYGIGYNIFCQDGEIKSEYIHKRLNEYSGVSSYRSIIPIESFNLRNKIHSFIKTIGWNGVAMVEFKIDKDGIPYLMEMNGRFYGSMELGIKAGFDYPSFLYATQYLNRPIKSPERTKPYTLRYFHDELFLETTKLFKTKKIGHFLKWFFSLFNLLTPGNYLEDNLFEDPSFVKNLYTYDFKRIKEKRKKKKKINSIEISEISSEAFEKLTNVLFICKGNICRSPFAEIYAKSIFPDKNFFSAGTVKIEKRLSPMNAITAAKELGIDLSHHTSKNIDQFDEKEIDGYIVMDKLNYYELMTSGINKNKIFFLSPIEIPDPYKQGAATFIKTYTTIKEQINRLAK